MCVFVCVCVVVVVVVVVCLFVVAVVLFVSLFVSLLLFGGLVFALREFAELFRFVGFSVVKCSSVRIIKQPLSWLTLEGLALFTIIRTGKARRAFREPEQ